MSEARAGGGRRRGDQEEQAVVRLAGGHRRGGKLQAAELSQHHPGGLNLDLRGDAHFVVQLI